MGYRNASHKATCLAEGIHLWAEYQDAMGVTAQRMAFEPFAAWSSFNPTLVDQAKKVQYDLMTWAINN